MSFPDSPTPPLSTPPSYDRVHVRTEAFGFYYDRGVVVDLRAAIKNPEDDDEYRQSVKHDPERVAEVESKLAVRMIADCVILVSWFTLPPRPQFQTIRVKLRA